MAFPLAAIPIIGEVANRILGVIDKVVPDKDMAAKMKAEAEAQLMQMDWNKIQMEFQDRSSARDLAKADVAAGSAISTFLAALHRPLWSLVMLALFAYSWISPSTGLPPAPLTDLHVNVMNTVLMFYFGGRTVEKVVEKYKNGK